MKHKCCITAVSCYFSDRPVGDAEKGARWDTLMGHKTPYLLGTVFPRVYRDFIYAKGERGKGDTLVRKGKTEGASCRVQYLDRKDNVDVK